MTQINNFEDFRRLYRENPNYCWGLPRVDLVKVLIDAAWQWDKKWQDMKDESLSVSDPNPPPEPERILIDNQNHSSSAIEVPPGVFEGYKEEWVGYHWPRRPKTNDK